MSWRGTVPSWLLLLCGCFAVGVEPRSADLAEPGRIGGAGTFSVMGVAPSEADVQTTDGRSGVNDEVVAMRAATHPLIVIGSVVYNTQGRFRVGVVRGVELGVDAGLQQLGGEVRVAVLDEDRGAPVSLALGGGSAWRPFMSVALPWTQVGLQLSSRVGSITPLVNLHASWGPETHALFLDESFSRECSGFGDEGCGEFAPPTNLQIHRAEMRLHLPIGLSYTVSELRYDHDEDFEAFFEEDYVPRSLHHDAPSGPIVTFAVTPYAIVYADGIEDVECVGCSYATATALRARFGGTLTIGVRSLDW
jgi:hypothetical protein